MGSRGNTLGIIAGGGELPVAIAGAARQSGREIFVLALEGSAREEEIGAFPHAWASIGQLGRMFALLKEAGCSDLTMAGRVNRPGVAQLKLDARGAMALPKVLAASLNGDDALLRALLGLFEKEGLRILGSAEVAASLLAPAGPLARAKPGRQDIADMRHALRVVAAMGALDIGQAAAVCHGLVLAVEAAEGTDAMIQRIATLPESIRGTEQARRGVLVKATKPRQERRVDSPVIGVRTVELCAAAGLAGIAVEAGAALILDREKVREAAERHGMFVYGFTPEERDE